MSKKSAAKIRLARNSDVEAIVALDDIDWRGTGRQRFIEGAIGNENCFVAVFDDRPVGYAVLEYAFFDNGFVSMLKVEAAYRRRGFGYSLMRHLESACRTPKLFTSTNLSNIPMQRVLAKLEYELSGVIHNLDPGDPELVYFRRASPEPD